MKVHFKIILLISISTNCIGSILEIIEKYLPTNPNILEAGANCGEDTVIMGNKWPSGKIFAFEPVDASFQQILEKTKSLSNVYPFKYALSDKIGKTNFYICINGNAASSILPPKEILDSILFFDKNKPIEVPTTTIDQWALENNISHIDFMWLDMEGAELLALKSSPKILSTVKVIYTEVNYQEFREGNCFYTDIKNFLEKLGFKEVWNNSWNWTEKNIPWQGNILFVRS